MKLHERFVYYFVYSSVWMAIMVIGYVQVLVFKKNVAPDCVT